MLPSNNPKAIQCLILLRKSRFLYERKTIFNSWLKFYLSNGDVFLKGPLGFFLEEIMSCHKKTREQTQRSQIYDSEKWLLDIFVQVLKE